MFAYTTGTQLSVVLLQANGDFSILAFIAALPLLFVVYLIVRFFAKLNQPIITDHKYQLFELTQLSALDFYTKIESILDGMQIAELKHSRITHGEGGMLSARREYLRVMYKGLGYTICGAAFGSSFFISWREDEPMHTRQKVVSSIPYVGKVLAAASFQKTRYREDTELMYRETVQGIMQRMVEAIGKEKGTRGLTELESKPLYVKSSIANADN